jgi:ribose transport system substrate-binding protein
MKPNRRGIRRLALLATLLLIIGACTTGTEEPEAPAAEGEATTAQQAGLIPDTIDPLEARERIYDEMRGKRVAFVPLLLSGFAITTQWATHMERAFDAFEIDFTVHDANFDSDQMVRIVDDLIAEGEVDLLVLHNPDVGLLTQQIRDAADAGIYTVIINLLSNASGDAFMGDDLMGSAQRITRRAAEDCEERGTNQIALLVGPGTDASSIQWSAGVESVAEETGLEIVATTQTDWQSDLANQQAATLIQQHGDDLCAILPAWDVIAIAAAEARDDAVAQGAIDDGSIGIYTSDSSVAGCDAVRDGRLEATIAYDVPGIGTAAVVAVQNLLQSNIPPGTQHTVAYVPTVILDQTNVDDVAMACYSGM